MNRRYRYTESEAGPGSRLEDAPLAALPFRTVREDSLEQLKSRLLASSLDRAWEPGQSVLLRRAANEAAALAWVTPYPTLVFPLLFEEKAEAARRHADRQAEVKKRSRELLAV